MFRCTMWWAKCCLFKINPWTTIIPHWNVPTLDGICICHARTGGWILNKRFCIFLSYIIIKRNTSMIFSRWMGIYNLHILTDDDSIIYNKPLCLGENVFFANIWHLFPCNLDLNNLKQFRYCMKSIALDYIFSTHNLDFYFYLFYLFG